LLYTTGKERHGVDLALIDATVSQKTAWLK